MFTNVVQWDIFSEMYDLGNRSGSPPIVNAPYWSNSTQFKFPGGAQTAVFVQKVHERKNEEINEAFESEKKEAQSESEEDN